MVSYIPVVFSFVPATNQQRISPRQLIWLLHIARRICENKTHIFHITNFKKNYLHLRTCIGTAQYYKVDIVHPFHHMWISTKCTLNQSNYQTKLAQEYSQTTEIWQTAYQAQTIALLLIPIYGMNGKIVYIVTIRWLFASPSAIHYWNPLLTLTQSLAMAFVLLPQWMSWKIAESKMDK